MSISFTCAVWSESISSQEVEQLACHLSPCSVVAVPDVAQFNQLMERARIDAVLLCLPLRHTPLSFAVAKIRRDHPSIPLLIHEPSCSSGHDLTALSTHDIYCVYGPSSPEKLANMVRVLMESGFPHQLNSMSKSVRQSPRSPEPWRANLIGESPEMQRIVELIRLIAPRRSTVLLTGETGTGKEVIARAIHEASDRAGRSMVAVNCGALPEALLEAELFGHSKGAFTGAVANRTGRFEQAHQSTIFLDEIGDLPLELQSKLLRVLQEREFQRIGSSETIKVDTRVIAATNADLQTAVDRKTFRGDLFYRLKVVPIHLPPLRQRTGDIPLLVQHFIDKICRKEGLSPKYVAPRAVERLTGYSWPGNVRQLEHAVETAIVLSGDRRLLEAEDFPCYEKRRVEPAEPRIEMPEEGLDFEAMMSRIQRYLLTQALEKAGGNKSRAAEMLHMKRSTLVSKVKTMGEGDTISTIEF